MLMLMSTGDEPFSSVSSAAGVWNEICAIAGAGCRADADEDGTAGAGEDPDETDAGNGAWVCRAASGAEEGANGADSGAGACEGKIIGV